MFTKKQRWEAFYSNAKSDFDWMGNCNERIGSPEKWRTIGSGHSDSSLHTEISGDRIRFEEKDLLFRRMMSKDLDQVTKIENHSFKRPWSRRSFEAELFKDIALSFVACIGEVVVGYIIAWKIIDELHIGNIAVHPDFRKRGIGAMLINYLIERARECRWVRLEVRCSNRAARALYRKLGFIEEGIRCGYYEDEDAIVMVKELDNSN